MASSLYPLSIFDLQPRLQQFRAFIVSLEALIGDLIACEVIKRTKCFSKWHIKFLEIQSVKIHTKDNVRNRSI